MVYLISYDLKQPGRNYDNLYKAIESVSAKVCCHCLESTWIIKSTLATAAILERLVAAIDDNDNLLVVEVTSNCTGRLPNGSWDYLNSTIFI